MQTSRFIRCVGLALQWAAVLFALSGCATNGKRLFTSRWAMDDPDYAKQYSTPYSDNKLTKWSRMGQQIVDARFQAGKSGLYVSAGGATKQRAAFGGEIGLFTLPNSWTTGRVGLIGLLAEGLPSYLVGGVAGVRVHAPTRVAPYVGLAAMAGYSQQTSTADHNYVDGDGKHVFVGDTVLGPSAGLAAIIPEAGVSWWVNYHIRANFAASYYITTDGRSEDFLLLGLGFDFGPEHETSGTHVETPSPELRRVIDAEPYFQSADEAPLIPVAPIPEDPVNLKGLDSEGEPPIFVPPRPVTDAESGTS